MGGGGVGDGGGELHRTKKLLLELLPLNILCRFYSKIWHYRNHCRYKGYWDRLLLLRANAHLSYDATFFFVCVLTLFTARLGICSGSDKKLTFPTKIWQLSATRHHHHLLFKKRFLLGPFSWVSKQNPLHSNSKTKHPVLQNKVIDMFRKKNTNLAFKY